MNRLQEQVVENQQLNNTLQMELSVYDKMHEDNKTKGKRYGKVFEKKKSLPEKKGKFPLSLPKQICPHDCETWLFTVHWRLFSSCFLLVSQIFL